MSAVQVSDVLRPHAEQQYAAELAALARHDDRPRPRAWNLSPWAVVTYVLGGTLQDGTVVTPKYVGAQRLVEVAVATLATDRALLLLGAPGTAKTWLSEHVAADPGHGRDQRGSGQVWLELRQADRGRTDPRRARSFAGHDRHARRQGRPRRGADQDAS